MTIQWVKSSTSTATTECVEATAEWQKAGLVIRMRDSKHPEGGTLDFTDMQWQHLLSAIRTHPAFNPGHFSDIDVDLGERTIFQMRSGKNGVYYFALQPQQSPKLPFTGREVAAFVSGVQKGEFSLGRMRELACEMSS